MLAEQRQREIVNRLTRSGGARVAELAKSLCVTEETIRRDLDKLGGQGKLIRTHGGALPIPEDRRELPFEQRETAHVAEKRRIAGRALAMVAEGDVLALDASSTVHELARLLPDIPLTVITNSLPVQFTLMGRAHVRVVSTGGVVDAPSRACLGLLAEQVLERFNVRKFFLSSKGFDPRRGLSEATEEQAHIKRRMMDQAQERILLLDHSKFGVNSVVRFAPPVDVHVLVTDSAAPPEALAELRGRGLRIEIA